MISLKSRALRYLSAREHSRSELARKLARHAAESDNLDALLDELEAGKFLSEERFAESLVNRRSARFIIVCCQIAAWLFIWRTLAIIGCLFVIGFRCDKREYLVCTRFLCTLLLRFAGFACSLVLRIAVVAFALTWARIRFLDRKSVV